MAEAMVDAWLGKVAAGSGFIGYAHRFSGLHELDAERPNLRATAFRFSRTIAGWREFAYFPIWCIVCIHTQPDAHRRAGVRAVTGSHAR